MGKHAAQDDPQHNGIGGLFTRRRAGRHAGQDASAATILRENRRTPVMAAIAIPTAAIAALGVAGAVNAAPSGDDSAAVAPEQAAAASAAQAPKAQDTADAAAQKAQQKAKDSGKAAGVSGTLTTPEPKPTPSTSAARTTASKSAASDSAKGTSSSSAKKSSKKKSSKSSSSGSSSESYKKNSKASGQGGTCKASTYGEGDGTAGRPTASGERFNPSKLTAAHKSLPMNSKVKVTNKSNGKTVTVRINDRGPYISGRCLDLSTAAMNKIGGDGVAKVSYKVL